MRKCQDHKRGFTLVEMSVVLIIVGLILTTVFPALMSVRVAEQRRLTDSNLQTLMRASAVYAQAHGCLPCPTPQQLKPVSATATGWGIVRGDTSTDPVACAGCPTPEGFVPFASMGLPQAVAMDGWGHWIRMRVDPALTADFGVIPPTATCKTTDPQPCPSGGTSNLGLCQSGLATGSIIVRTMSINNLQTEQNVAIVFLSHGPNGYGALVFPKKSSATYDFPANSFNTFERINAGLSIPPNEDKRVFIQAHLTQTPTESFDDILTYLDRNNIVSFFGQGSCQKDRP